MVNRIFRLIVGSMIMGVGISIAIAGGLGVDPMTLFWEGINVQTGLSYGNANLIVCSVLIVMIYFIDKTQLGIGTIVNAIVMSTTMDVLNTIFVKPNYIVLCFLYLLLGFVLLAMGVAYYGKANLGRGAFDAFVFGVANTTRFSIRTTRIACDIFLAIAGIVLGAQFKIGPVISVFCVGPLIQFFVELLDEKMK